MKIHQTQLLPIPVDTTSSHQNTIAMRTDSKLRPTAPEFVPQSQPLPVYTTQSSVSSDSVPEFTTQESTEADPEAVAELEKYVQSKPSLPEPTPPVDDPMVDRTLCRICGCGLISDTSSQEPGEATESDDSETYANHIRTEKHITNSEIYEHFLSEEVDYYIPRKTELSELLSTGAILFDKTMDKKLQSMMDCVQKEIKDGDIGIEKIRQSADWSEGLKLLENLSGKLESLRARLKGAIDASEKRWSDMEKAKKLEEKKDEEDNKEVSSDEEDLVIEDIDYGARDRDIKRMQKVKIKRERQRR